MDNDNRKTLVVIPALNPTSSLIDYVEELIDYGSFDVLVIDDGSKAETKAIFNRLNIMKNCRVLSHAKTLGRGRALKNGFNYFLNLPNLDNYIGLVTSDSDGQHIVEDVVKVALEMKKNPNNLVLGSRNFNVFSLPQKIKFANKVTSLAFRNLYGRNIADTQTILRGLPKNMVALMIDVEGERFDYETRMLTKAIAEDIKITEIEIETVFNYSNVEKNFNPIFDLISICKVILLPFLKFSLASLSAFLVDISLFRVFLTILVFLGVKKGYLLILLTTFLARAISSFINFLINKNLVFKQEKNIKKTIYKYYTISLSKIFLSSFLVYLLWKWTSGSETVIKIIIDTILFFLSYRLQYTWVFKNIKNKK
ncbi:glycosyltransferase [Gemella sp. zg-1178]|uniref:glycosyltransferase n=1 Tax=Gemella sp. zg-1178 TaxID=2840372 RepID=UPI001C059531|nr:glycosyltransferase [Gemella sp. zg-1178]MBU0279116.1 bifunctional glycosyltransferase family 2/GtrA family protein [Gemella sp. zg-1178]